MRWGKAATNCWREEPHVAGQANQIDAVRAQAGDHIGVVLFALASAGNKDRGGQTHLARFGQAGCVSDIRDDDGDFGALQAAGANGFGNGKEVGAAAGEEDAEATLRVLAAAFRLRMQMQILLRLTPTRAKLRSG